MALTTGAYVGSYEVTAPIGAGGMGEVYRARDTKLNRDVALKILPDVQLTHVSVTTQPSFVFGNPARVTSGTEGAGTDLPFNPRNYDVTPDGQRFIRVVDADVATRKGPLPNPTLNVVLNWSEELKQRVPVK